MKLKIEIANDIVNDVAEVLGVEPTQTAIENYFTDFIIGTVSGAKLRKEYATKIVETSNQLKAKIKRDEGND